MKHAIIRLFVGALTFLLGVCGVYLAWRSQQKPAELLSVTASFELPKYAGKIVTPRETADQFKLVKEDFEKIAEFRGCTFGKIYYDPAFESSGSQERDFGPFFSKKWITILRQDKDITIPFLISQISDKSKTNVHIDPYDMATKGELAIYCLQFVLKINWYDLKEDYRTRYDTINMEYTNPQALLQRIIRTKRGAAEMMNLWKQVSEREP